MQIMITGDHTAEDNHLWKNLFREFAVQGDYFEIHCWKNEKSELKLAELFGEDACFGMPNLKIIHGTLSDKFISYLLGEKKPREVHCYHKMVPFFTLLVGDRFSSEEYGTRIILTLRSETELKKIKYLLAMSKSNVKAYQKIDNRDIWRVL